MRTVNIEDYWTLIIRNTAEFGQIAAAENPEFNRLSECVYRVLKDSFIKEATEYGVRRWETMLGLAVNTSATLDDRKAAILTYLSIKLPYTWRVLKQMLVNYLGEDNFTLSQDPETETLHMSMTDSAMKKLDDVKQLFDRVLPMNLVVKYDDVPMDYTLLEYLESSGTQNIHLDTPNMRKSSEKWQQSVFMQFLSETNSLVGWKPTSGFYWGRMDSLFTLGKTFGITADGEKHEFNYTCQKSKDANGDDVFMSTLAVEDSIVQRSSYPSDPTEWKFGLFAPSFNKDGYVGSLKIWSCKCWCDSVSYDLVPVLNADGVPGMWDKVGKQFLGNDGSGSFGYRKLTGETVEPMPLDLDDPYYTAPSGVWVKLIDENELDIIASTDLEDGTEQGYKMFANVGDACKYFNIKEVIEDE